MSINFNKNLVGQCLYIRFFKPTKGNPLNTNTLRALGDELEGLDDSVRTVLITGFLDRGLDISEMVQTLTPDDFKHIGNYFSIYAKDHLVYATTPKRIVESLDDAVYVFQELGRLMYRVLGQFIRIHEEGVQTVAIIDNCVAGGAVICAACQRVFSTSLSNVHYLPESLFDVEATLVVPLLRQKHITDDVILGYILGVPFKTEAALKVGLIDGLIPKEKVEKVVDYVVNSGTSILYSYLINRSSFTKNYEKYYDTTPPVLDRTIAFINDKEVKGLSTTDALNRSLEQAIPKVGHESVLRLLHFVWKDKRLRNYAPK